MKRLLDVTLALLALVLAAPIMLVIALAIWMTMDRPVFFVQTRPGLLGKPFRLIKFRTMREAYDARGERLPEHLRLTRLGRFLRSMSLDELPEFWNVLRGDMSLVGPRPLLMDYLPLYNEEQARRHEVKPGITGWAQVNGRNALTWDNKFRLDVWYVENQNVWLDLRILAMTVLAVLKRQGINHSAERPMPRFMGSSKES